jgi:ATP-dependent DNA helicase RecG
MTTTADDIRQLLQSGRSVHTEWFGEGTPLSDIAATLVAMANSQGGRLLLGVAGSAAEITGVSDAETTIDQILQAALSVDPPLIIPLPRAARLKDKTVIIAHIPPGMPHVYSLDGRYLYRHGDTNAALNPRDLRRLLLERGELSFETEIARGTSLDDVDWEKAKTYATGLSGIGEANVEQVLIKRGCLAQQDGRLRPTNAGILLFGKDAQRHIRGAEITAVRFAGESMSDTFMRQDIVGTLPDQIRRAETFLIDHLRKGVQLRHTMERRERFEYPMEAARELVVNAVAHRDYSISGDGIRLFIFGNRMEVNSPGGLPGPVTIANIKDERFSRNPAIVQVLADMGFIERLGYGVDRVIELMRQQNLRAPEFEETGGGFRVVLYSHLEKPDGKDGSADQSVEFHGLYKNISINPRQEAALIYLHSDGNTRITNSDLQGLCPDVHPETIRRDLADLVTKHILEKMGQKRGSYYVLKNV